MVPNPGPLPASIFGYRAKVESVSASRIDTSADRRSARLEPVVERRRIDEIGFRGDEIAAQLTGAGQNVASPGEQIVHNPHLAGACADEEETAALEPVVYYRVVDEIEFIERVLQPLGAVGYDRGIFRRRPMLDHVADHERQAAVR